LYDASLIAPLGIYVDKIGSRVTTVAQRTSLEHTGSTYQKRKQRYVASPFSKFTHPFMFILAMETSGGSAGMSDLCSTYQTILTGIAHPPEEGSQRKEEAKGYVGPESTVTDNNR
jgi:hypothetical protein